MKKLTTAFFALILTTVTTFAASPDADFETGADTFGNEFAELDKVEAYINANEGITLDELTTNHREVLADVTLIEDTSTMFTADRMPIVGGFWWGCLLGIVGLVLVYFITDNDRDEVRKALIGCVITTLVIGLGGVFNVFSIF